MTLVNVKRVLGRTALIARFATPPGWKLRSVTTDNDIGLDLDSWRHPEPGVDDSVAITNAKASIDSACLQV